MTDRRGPDRLTSPPVDPLDELHEINNKMFRYCLEHFTDDDPKVMERFRKMSHEMTDAITKKSDRINFVLGEVEAHVGMPFTLEEFQPKETA